MPMSGVVFDIQRFAVHDGPGIRTTVFLKGCSNRCGWCHNPESLSFQPQLQYYSSRCVRCGACVAACPVGAHRVNEQGHRFDRVRCIACGECAQACNVQALVMSGRRMTVDQVMAQVMADAPYYARSGGGMTLSGGEPVLQADFALALLAHARERGVHTCVETAGNYPPGLIDRLLPFIDLVLFDLKAWDEAIYRDCVGATRQSALDTLHHIDASGVPIIVRTPVIGGVNDAPDEIEAIAQHLTTIKNLKHYALIPYHALGKVKYDALGLSFDAPYDTPPREKMESLERLAALHVPVFNQTQGYR